MNIQRINFLCLGVLFFVGTVYYFPYAIWFAFAPLLIVLWAEKKHLVVYSAGTGIAIGVLLSYWTSYYYVSSFFLVCAIVSLFFSLFFYGAVTVLHRYDPKKALFLIPAWWMALMVLFSLSPIGSFWTNISFLQPLLGSLLAFITSYGATALIIFVNGLVAVLWIRPQLRGRSSYGVLLTILFIVALVQYNSAIAVQEGTPFTVSLVQGNFDESWEWRTEHADTEILNTYIDLSVAAKSASPDLIVWPEYSIPIDLAKNDAVLVRLQNLTNHLNTPIVLGSITLVNKKPYQRYNTLLLINSDGTYEKYDSVKPFPFDKYTVAQSNLGVVHVRNRTIGLAACYEEAQRDIMRSLAHHPVDFIVVAANNQHIIHSPGPQLTSLLSRWQAAEQQTYVVRATNNGLTQIISPTGQVLAQLQPNKRGVLTHTIYI